MNKIVNADAAGCMQYVICIFLLQCADPLVDGYLF